MIPRDRNSEFTTDLLPSYARPEDYLEAMVIKHYQTGGTTREIRDLIEKMYGHHYSPSTISNITKVTQENVAAFHERQLKPHYSVLYLDGTYLPLRRGTVSKECVHIALGITHDGYKEALGYEIAQNEKLTSWSDLLDKLKTRGLEQVSLVVTDGLRGMDDLITQAFPLAKQQRCLVHVARNFASKVKRADCAIILDQFKRVYQANSMVEAIKNLETFMNDWSPKYKKMMDNLAQTRYLLTFFEFPKSIRKSIYSTNLIESLNKEIKRQTKKRAAFPNEEAFERCLVSIFENYNLKNEQRIHTGFGICSDTLESLIL